MKFSWFHLPTFSQEFHGSESQFYQDMLEETDRAESLGFHAVWCAEHHFYDYGGHIPSVPVLGAAIAQRTKRLRQQPIKKRHTPSGTRPIKSCVKASRSWTTISIWIPIA